MINWLINLLRGKWADTGNPQLCPTCNGAKVIEVEGDVLPML